MIVTLRRNGANRQSQSARIGRLRLELLEDRTVPSTLFVDPSGHTPGGQVAYTTIQAAVSAAAAGDTIRVDPASYTENVTIPASDAGLRAYPDNSICP